MADTKRKYEAKETDVVSQKLQKTGEKGETLTSSGSAAGKGANDYSTNPRFLVAMLHTPVETLKPASNVILVAQRTDLVTEVWKGLVRNNFLSCPVLQQTKKKYYGFIDLHDILDFITKKFDANKLETAKDFWNLMEADKEFMQTTVTHVIQNPILKRNPYHPVTTGYSLLSAVELLAREPGLHRVPIVDADRQLKSLLTQSQVVDFVVANIHLLGDIRSKPVSQMESGNKQVLTVKPTVSTMEAFKFMASHQITGVAVVDESGRLTDVLTLKDLKAISTDGQMFWRLYQTVEVFLKKVREESPNKPKQPIHCLPDQTFEQVIRTISNNRIHRVFIVDSPDTMKPIGIISMKDVLKEILTS